MTSQEGKDRRGPYSEKLATNKSLSTNGISSRKHGLYAQRSVDSFTKGQPSFEPGSFPSMFHRSRTMPPVAASSEGLLSHVTKIKSRALLELERRARKEAEAAMKENKIFTIVGPYHSLRSALRRRGWVEKFNNAPLPCEMQISPNLLRKSSSPAEYNRQADVNCSLTDDDGNWRSISTKPRLPPWEEESGLHGIMSHLVRNSTPSFVFTVKTSDVSSRTLTNGQLVNHYGKASTFTTKARLGENLKNLPWYEKEESDTFYPRSYTISNSEEKEEFVDDYRITACLGFLKYFVTKYKYLTDKTSEELSSINTAENSDAIVTENSAQNEDNIIPTDEKDASTAQTDSLVSNDEEKKNAQDIIVVADADNDQESSSSDISTIVISSPPISSKMPSGGTVTVKALEIALQQCEFWLKSKQHEDIDLKKRERTLALLTDTEWDKFLSCYYQFVHENGEVKPVSPIMVDQCEDLLNKIKPFHPQYLINGCRNVWILKPAGKSRGRGIQCSDRLNSIMQKVEESSENHFIVQKYIERPFLVYKTKFDIRQWFLVTDFNPLTVWFYKHCYLRFCSQEYTLDNFHEAIHLSNNSVQKHYSNHVDRSEQLPSDNMWTCTEFNDWLRNNGHGNVWTTQVIPGIKKALLCSLLCCQEFIECRKNAFELYGADFMLSEDLTPWLLEINCSPSMCKNTQATSQLVDMVMEDTLKVVLDRRSDKNADTGAFQLLYKAPPISEPPGSDASFMVQGRRIRKKFPRR